MDLLDSRPRARAPTPTRPIPASGSARRSRCPDGSVHAGCNVENVAYPEGTCAEAGAIAAMVAAGRTEIAEVLVVADSPEPVTPCGGCRQKLAEFARPTTPVILAGLAGERAPHHRRGAAAGRLRAGAPGRSASRDRDAAVAARALACLDLTNLDDGCDDGGDRCALRAARVTPHGAVAAVCVWPDFVAQAKRGAGRHRRSASPRWSTFPRRRTTLDDVREETRAALADGADEIDLVVPWRR